MEKLLELISKAYVYIPASVLAALAIIIPAVIKLVKISTSNSALSLRIMILGKKVKNRDKAIDTLVKDRREDLEDRKHYLIEANKLTINKKQRELNEHEIQAIDAKLSNLTKFEEECAEERKHEEEIETKKKKIRVKVVKNVVAESIAENKESK